MIKKIRKHVGDVNVLDIIKGGPQVYRFNARMQIRYQKRLESVSN